jgi:hypothetical protein
MTSNTFNEQVLHDYDLLNSEKTELAFIEKYKKDKDVTVMGYVCSIQMKQASYSYNPIKKLAIFKEEKDKLELFIKKEPDNVHLRYIRYFIQLKTPSMLNYKDNLTEDKKVLADHLKSQVGNDLLRNFIKKNCQL